MNPTILGVIGPGFLNQVPTLPVLGAWFRGFKGSGFSLGVQGLGCRGAGFRVYQGYRVYNREKTFERTILA